MSVIYDRQKNCLMFVTVYDCMFANIHSTLFRGYQRGKDPGPPILPCLVFVNHQMLIDINFQLMFIGIVECSMFLPLRKGEDLMGWPIEDIEKRKLPNLDPSHIYL